MKRAVETTPASLFFQGELPYYVNRISENFNLHLHDHEFTEICYVSAGSGFQYIGEDTIAVNEGDLFILPVGTPHVFRPRSPSASKPLIVYNFIFMAEQVSSQLGGFPGLEQLPRAMEQLNLLPGVPGWKHWKDRTGFFRRFFSDAYEEFRFRRDGFLPRMHGQFIVLLTEIERCLQAEASSSAEASAAGAAGVAVPHFLQEAFDLIHSSYTHNLTAAAVASAAGISERHFHRLFVQAAGVTYTRYIQNLRIEQSCELLRTTRMSVAEIAETAGYQDKGYFLQLFKRHIGISPREYRNRPENRNHHR